MVDSTSGLGSIQNLSSVTRAQNAQEERRAEATESREPVDEVNISQEALDVAAAEQAAEEARAELSENLGATLSREGALDAIA